MSYDNTNTGALFTNDRKTNDRQPGFTGKVDVEGKEYWLSAWAKKTKAGKPFMSLALTPVDAAPAPKKTTGTKVDPLEEFMGAAETETASGPKYNPDEGINFDDDIPF